MKLPTEREINPHPGCLDGEYAVKMFLGKDLEEAEILFRENGLPRREDLMYMGPFGFVFYFSAALRYLKSSMSAGDSDFASSMTGLLEWRILGEYEDYDQIISARTEMIEFCSHLVENYDFYDIDLGIYGDLRPRLERLLGKLQGEQAGAGRPTTRPSRILRVATNLNLNRRGATGSGCQASSLGQID